MATRSPVELEGLPPQNSARAIFLPVALILGKEPPPPKHTCWGQSNTGPVKTFSSLALAPPARSSMQFKIV